VPVFTAAISALVEIGLSTYFATALVTPTLGISLSEFDAADTKSKEDES
jgi:hypothetical protein